MEKDVTFDGYVCRLVLDNGHGESQLGWGWKRAIAMMCGISH